MHTARSIIEALSREDAIAIFAKYGVLDADRLVPRRLRLAYLKLVKDHHPDTGGHTKAMQEINAAYDELKTSVSGPRGKPTPPPPKKQPDDTDPRAAKFCNDVISELKRRSDRSEYPFSQIYKWANDHENVYYDSVYFISPGGNCTLGFDLADQDGDVTKGFQCDAAFASGEWPGSFDDELEALEGHIWTDAKQCAADIWEIYYRAATAFAHLL